MSMITLYNSLHRKKEEFVPLKPGKVGLYTCGPTVYDYPHVGNMRAYLTWDILKRFLIASGFEVTHIMNITDVGHLTSDADSGEDKMEIAKKRERATAWDIAEKYYEHFLETTKRLNIKPATKYVKATDCIDEMLAFVKKLDEKGFLYRTSDGLYFDTSKDPEYGTLGNIKAEGLRSGARVEENPEKKNITDFAVWKFSPSGEQRDMEWESEWGKGFPGWHLECSAISLKYLDETFDIHTGGKDHLTIHHPNEMAQSKALTGKLQARYWLHNNFVNFKDKKIAKSSGTFVKLEDIEHGGVSALAYRYFVLQTQYRKELVYSWEAIQAAQAGLTNLYVEISLLGETVGPVDQKFQEDFMNALSDDLNTAKALDVVQKVLKSKLSSEEKLGTIFFFDTVLGLSFKSEWERRRKIPASAKPLLEQRAKAREEKDWKRADELRDELMKMNVVVQDTADGQVAVVE